MSYENFVGDNRERQLQLEEAFGFTRELMHQQIDGEKYLSKDGKPLNAITLMKESEFVKNWIIQFALNTSASGNNYFNFPAWGELSNQHTMAVMVVDDEDEDKTLFIIKPFASYEMSDKERDVLQQTHSAMLSSIQASVDGQIPQLSTTFIADEASKHMERPSRKPIHELVPIEFFHKHKVYPYALHAVYYIRDELYKGKIDQSILFKLKDIFEKEEIEGCADRADYEYVKQICGDEYQIPEDKLAAKGDKAPVINNEEDNNTGDDILS